MRCFFIFLSIFLFDLFQEPLKLEPESADPKPDKIPSEIDPDPVKLVRNACVQPDRLDRFLFCTCQKVLQNKRINCLYEDILRVISFMLAT